MNLPFFSKNKNKSDYYLGIFLKEEDGILMLMDNKDGKMAVHEKENFTYTNGWENLSNDIDEVLYRFEKKINKSVDKTIFFVYSHLVDEKIGDIKQPYLQKIKELVKSLELNALGYIECYEAVTKSIQSREEIPLTGILVELDSHDLTMFIYKGGNITHKKNVARTDNISEDLIKAMSDLKGKFLLPSRIILYNSHDLDPLVDKIISYHWDEQYFIQLPRVDIIKEDEITAGLVSVFAEQIGSKKAEEEIVVAENKETFGFLINEDVAQKQSPKPVAQLQEMVEEHKDESVRPKFVAPTLTMPKVNFKIPKVSFSFLSGKLTIVAGLLIILAALFLNEYFFHKANLKVYMNSSSITKTADFRVEYKVATASASYTQNTGTTGSRQIGDPARGQVTVHNFEDGEKTFSKGTEIENAGIKFALDTDVKVASSSLASDGSAKLPGKNNVSVTAAAIGPEGNLGKGSRFTITDLPSNTYFAISESAFTGGSKKTVRTVSTADQDKLETAVLNSAKKQVSLPKGSSGSLITELTKITLAETVFSKEIGEESNSVSLNAKAMTTFYLYEKNELLDKIQEEIKNDVRSGFTIDRTLVDYKINKTELTDGDTVEINTAVTARTVKKVDEGDIMNRVVGRNKKSLDGLKDKLDIEGYNLVINEPIPFLDNFLPFFKKNINIIITTL
jgi:hypothetical protein